MSENIITSLIPSTPNPTIETVKKIADLFSRIHFGEKLGSGMQRMKNICRKENAPFPKIDFTDTHFYITFKQNKEYLEMARSEKVVRKGGQKMS